jgi:peptidoglycan hydrolase-like protein with peptidoglycan-binding domain
VRRRTSTRSRKVAVAGGVVALVGTAAGGVALGAGAVGLDSGRAASGSTAGDLPPATAEVTRQTLVDQQAENGTLGYGDTTTITNQQQGTVTWVPAEGRVLRRGATLYRVNALPVTLMYGDVPMYRRLAKGVDDGSDVEQLERNLRALGYTGFTVDDEFSSATAAAVKRWQKDRGLAKTGSVDVGQVVFTPGPVRVDTDRLKVGGLAGPGAAALDVTGTSRIVTVALDVADQRLARKGAKVTVELPGGKSVNGTIAKVGDVAHAASDDQDQPQDDSSDDSTIDVTIDLAAGGSTGAIDQAPVTVNFTSQQHQNVLSVPIAALLALSEGGYGVQVVQGSSARIVAVRTGLFADGQVELSGPGITEGTSVGVPKS